MIDTVLAVLVSLGLGSVLGWWLTHRFGLEIAHKHRIIEEHAKRVHEYSAKYYLKLIVYIEFVEKCLRGILEELRGSRSPSEETLELSLFGLARLSKFEEEWFRDASATLLLTDRTAERLIACLREQTEESLTSKLGCIGREDDSVIREHIGPYEPLSHFRVKIRSEPLKEIAEKYKVSIQRDTESLDSLVNTMGCLHKLLYFEVNACFDAWYAKKTTKPRFRDGESAILAATLDQLQVEGRLTSDDQEEYVKKISIPVGRKVNSDRHSRT